MELVATFVLIPYYSDMQAAAQTVIKYSSIRDAYFTVYTYNKNLLLRKMKVQIQINSYWILDKAYDLP